MNTHRTTPVTELDDNTARARCVFCCRANDGRSIQIHDGRFVRHLAGAGGECSGSGQVAADLTITSAAVSTPATREEQ